MLKGVVFDLDGVLVDAEEMSIDASSKALSHYGITKEHLKSLWHDFMGMSDYNIAMLINERLGKQVPVKEYVALKDEEYCKAIQEMDIEIKGAKQLIQRLKGSGLRLAVASSGSTFKVNCSLTKAGLLKEFKIIVTGSDVHHSKPNPEIYQIAAAKLGLSPGECVAVEDAVNGITAAKGAGMKVVAITTSFPKEKLAEADLIIKSLDELDAERLSHLFE